MSEAEPTLQLTAALGPEQPEKKELPQHVDNWDEYFLWIAAAVAINSKEPNCSVGAVIVSEDNVILSTGFNGYARGVHDDHTLFSH